MDPIRTTKVDNYGHRRKINCYGYGPKLKLTR